MMVPLCAYPAISTAHIAVAGNDLDQTVASTKMRDNFWRVENRNKKYSF